MEVEVVLDAKPPSMRFVFLLMPLFFAFLAEGLGIEIASGSWRGTFSWDGSLASALATFAAGVRLGLVFIAIFAFADLGLGIDGARFTMAFGDSLGMSFLMAVRT